MVGVLTFSSDPLGLEGDIRLSGNFRSYSSLRYLTFVLIEDLSSRTEFQSFWDFLSVVSQYLFFLLPIDFSIFSDISEKSLSEMLGIISVLGLEASGSPSELVKESLLVFLLEDLSGIYNY